MDERLVALAPTTVDDASAAALPLTSITAYELLFDRIEVPRRRAAGGGLAQWRRGPSDTLLVVGAGGGVGSILVQLARQLTDLTVVATASRQVTADWVRHSGAHEVIDHSKPLSQELEATGLPAPRS